MTKEDLQKVLDWIKANWMMLAIGFVVVGALLFFVWKGIKKKKYIQRRMAAARRAKKAKGKRKR